MSYKTTIQTHNAQLQENSTLLAQAIDKANALPDAGGGSGEIETCTVVFTSTGFNMGYTNGNQAYVEEPIIEETTLTVAKNTLLWTYGSCETHTGGIQVPVQAYEYYLFLITGDGTINIGD